jgi:hypothetical protein
VVLTREQRSAYASRAAEILAEGRAEWIQSAWIKDLEDDMRIGSSESFGTIRRWLSERGLLTRNKRCGVCAEGALLLALVEDESIPDETAADQVLRTFLPDAREAVVEFDWWDEEDELESIPSLNDDYVSDDDSGRKTIVRVLQRMART